MPFNACFSKNAQLSAPKGGSAYCAAGTCRPACGPGYTVCSNQCVALGIDALNCGSCGHICDYTTQFCLQGTCVLRPSVLLATGLSAPDDLISDGTTLFWTDPQEAAIHTIPITGGTLGTLASSQTGIVRLAVDDTYVYVTNKLTASVNRIPKSGGSPTLVSGGAEPLEIAIAGSNVYWTSNRPGPSIFTAPKSGGQAVAVKLYPDPEMFTITTNEFGDLASDGRFVAVMAGPVNAYRPPRLIDSANGNALLPGPTGSGAHVAITNQYFIYGADTLVIEDRLTGSLRLFAQQNRPLLGRLGADGCAAYNAQTDGLYMFPLQAPARAPLMAGPAAIKRVISDGTYLYWTQDTAVGRMPVP